MSNHETAGEQDPVRPKRRSLRGLLKGIVSRQQAEPLPLQSREELEDWLSGALVDAIAETYRRANAPLVPRQELTDDELDRLLKAGEALRWDNGMIGWINNPDDKALTPHQRAVQDELTEYAAPLVAGGTDLNIARQLAMLDYVIQHPQSFISSMPIPPES